MGNADYHPLEFFCPCKFSDIEERGAVVVNASEGEKSTVPPTINKSERRNMIAPNLDCHVIVDNPGNSGVDVKCEDAATRVDERFWRDEKRLIRLDLHKALLERDTGHADGKVWQCVKFLPRRHPSHVHPCAHFCLKPISALLRHLKFGNWRVEHRAPILGWT